MNRLVSVLTVSVNDAFAVESLIFIKRTARTKSVGIDGEKLLVVVSREESDRRFICGFCWSNVPLLGAAINENATAGRASSL